MWSQIADLLAQMQRDFYRNLMSIKKVNLFLILYYTVGDA
jgi:hypothetical protein